MKSILQSFFFLGIFIISINYNIYSQINHNSFVSQSDFKTAMQLLWGDYVILTREVILSIIDERSGTTQAIENLRRNQGDIGNALRPYYGEDIANKVTELLDANVSSIVDFLKAVKSNNADDLEKAKQKLFKNGDDIVAYLVGVNQYLASNELTQMMHDHLSATIDEAFARLKKDTSADMAAYEKVHSQILLLSDMIADSIIKQFPDKFI